MSKQGLENSKKTRFNQGNKFPKEIEERRIKNVIKGLLKRPTSFEKKLNKIIQKHNLPYKYTGDGSFLIGYKNPDFINYNGKKICLEVYYTYFKNRDYGTEKNYIEKRAKHCARYGWECLFFNENDLKKEEEFFIKVLQKSVKKHNLESRREATRTKNSG